ncbi:hypothetical protein FC093_13315 [Ilyomonas limi]|uniref:DUF4595 domain-containing protein n=1 Tax=Ilyomonas limi TaxID=2575867 RepID=A0A4U3L0P3_9BACT|nr:hypothetical protein [Ilyomonas limi]TKK67724.1 hypothetical protein FC093_13315 [Ilyomonas limi]
MKTTQFILLLVIALICITTACRKTVDVTSTTLNTGTQQQTDEAGIGIYPFNKNRCLLTQNLYEDGSGITIFYNDHKNADSVYFGLPGSPWLRVYAKYDEFDRLREIHWANFDGPIEKDYQLLTYAKGILPNQLKYIAADYKEAGFTDSVNAIWRFKYNLRGNVTTIDFVNLFWVPVARYKVSYEYDGQDNLAKVTRDYQDLYTLTVDKIDYDRKPNIWGGNFWFKFLFMTQPIPSYDDLQSRNNIREDKGVYSGPDQGFHEWYKYEYNDKGFASHQFDSSYYYYISDTSTYVINLYNLSTCDVLRPDLRSPVIAPKNTLSLPKYMTKQAYPWILMPGKKGLMR